MPIITQAWRASRRTIGVRAQGSPNDHAITTARNPGRPQPADLRPEEPLSPRRKPCPSAPRGCDPVRNCGFFRERGAGRRRRNQARLTKLDDARSGTLLLKTDDGYADATGSAPTSTSPSPARPSAPASRRSSATRRRTGSRRLRLSAARGRRGRHAEDGDRRRASSSATSRSGSRPSAIYEQAKADGQQGGLDRAGAAEHLHQLGRQYRPGRDRRGADRVPGAGAAVRRRDSRCACRWSSRPRYNPTPVVQTRRLRATAAAGARTSTIRCRTATASRRRCSIPRQNAPVNPDHHHGAPRRPASRSARSRATITPSRPRATDEATPHHHARRRRRCRPTAISS